MQKKRLIQMGELNDHIFPIGSPDIDIMMSENLPSKEELRNYYTIPFEKYAILIFHPVTTELESLEKQTNSLITAAINSKKNYVIIYPNNDPGSKIILKAYDQLKNNNRFIPEIFAVDIFGNERKLNYSIEEGYIVVNSVETQYTLRAGNDLLCIFNEKLIKSPIQANF